MRVAVVGTGIAGNAAAWTLSKHYPVTVYDRELRPGGHSHTVTIDYDGTPACGRYRLHRLQRTELSGPDGAVRPSRRRDGRKLHEFCGDGGHRPLRVERRRQQLVRDRARPVRASRATCCRPPISGCCATSCTFNQQSIEDYAAGKLAGLTLGDYFRTRHFAPRLLTDYLAPMGAAIWSAPASEMLDFPAENFVAFFANHRLLQYDRPVWRTVKGGSQRYVEKLTAVIPRPDQARLRRHGDRAHAAWRRRP